MTKLKHSLYHEHFEEISAVYDQMLCLKEQDLIPWPDFMRRDRLLEAHVDGLGLGGADVLELCREKVVNGDAGECYGAVRVLVRIKATRELQQAAEQLALTDKSRLDSVARAFMHETPDRDMENTVRDFFDRKGVFTHLAVRISGYHRLDVAKNLYDIIRADETGNAGLIDAINAIGRVKPDGGADRLVRFLSSDNIPLRNSALSALVRLGDPGVLRLCFQNVPADQWPGNEAGLAGKKRLIQAIFTDPDPTPDHLLAAGMTGDLSAVPVLMFFLEHEKLAAHAAFSLNLITAAGLREEIFVPEEIDENFMTDKEIRLLAQGIRPGKTVARISRNPAVWSAWWKQEHSRFHTGIRYRLGQPISPWCLHHILASENHPAALRNMAADELSVRYGLDTAFDPWMSVKAQRSVIRSLHDRIERNIGRFREGVLYFHSCPVNQEDDFVHHHQ